MKSSETWGLPLPRSPCPTPSPQLLPWESPICCALARACSQGARGRIGAWTAGERLPVAARPMISALPRYSSFLSGCSHTPSSLPIYILSLTLRLCSSFLPGCAPLQHASVAEDTSVPAFWLNHAWRMKLQKAFPLTSERFMSEWGRQHGFPGLVYSVWERGVDVSEIVS